MWKFIKTLFTYLNNHAWFMCKIYDGEYIMNWKECKTIVELKEASKNKYHLTRKKRQ